MAQIPSKQRRTQYIIAKDFQLRFALLLSGVGLAVTSVIGFILYSVLARAQSLFVGTGMVLSPSVIEFLGEQRSLFVYSLLGTFLGVTLILMILGIFISHRLAGPIFALSRRMNDLAQGNFNAVLTLRKADEFQDLKDKFNTLVHALQNQVKSELIKVNSVIESLKTVSEKASLSGEASDHLKSAFHELQSYYNYKKSLIEAPSSQTFKPKSTPEDEVLI